MLKCLLLVVHNEEHVITPSAKKHILYVNMQNLLVISGFRFFTFEQALIHPQ